MQCQVGKMIMYLKQRGRLARLSFAADASAERQIKGRKETLTRERLLVK